MTWSKPLGGFALCAILAGCLDEHTIVSDDATTADTLAARPAGWSEESHGKKAIPNYDTVFATSRVRTIEVVLTDSAYQAMRDDLTRLIGASGTRQGNMQGPLEPIDTSMKFMPGLDSTGRPPFGDTTFRRPPGDTSTGKPPQGGVGMNQDAMVDMIPGEPIYVPADLKMGDKIWTHVGIRFKGNSSLSNAWQSGSAKLPFRIDSDHYDDRFPATKGQRIWGFQKLAFNNASGDASLMREMLATEVFRGFGVPSPKAAFVRVVMRHGAASDTLGVYTMVEIPDDPLLDTWYGSHAGNLYKPEGTGAKFSSMVDSTFLVDASDISDVRAMVAALNDRTSDSAAWRGALEKTFDIPVFLKWLAVNTAIQNWDAYGQMAHNFYLYGDHGKLGWIAWDLGLSFQSGMQMGTSVWHTSVDSTWPLIHRVLADPTYRRAYGDRMRSLLGTHYTAAAMTAKVDAWNALVEPYLTPAERSGFATAVSQLRQAPATRIATLRADLDAAP